LARLCLSIPDLCSNIQTITDYQEGIDQQQQRTPIKRQLSSHTRESLYRNAKRVSSESLQKINKEFREQSSFAVSIWSDWTCATCRALVEKTLRADDDHFVFSATDWDTVPIEEEGEGGVKVMSTIRVPTMVILYKNRFIFL